MDFSQYPMINRYERIYALPESELERRWEAIRQVMRAHGLTVTLFFQLEDCGTGWWLLDCSNKLPACVVLPLEDDPVAVYPSRTAGEAGRFNRRPYPGRTVVEDDPYGRIANVNQCPSVRRYLKAGQPARIGVFHGEAMTVALRRELLEGAQDAELVDITADIARARSLKSPFDQQLCRASAQMHRVFLEAVPSVVRIGRTEKEVLADLHRLAMDMGSGGEDMCLMMHSFTPRGEFLPADAYLELPGRRFEEGDLFSILLETSGPGGMFAANLRYWSFGDVTDEFMERYRIAVGAQDLVQSLLKPGVSLRQTADQVNDYIRGTGHYTDNCCYMHSMGYAMGDYPCLTDNSAHQRKLPEEDEPLRPGTLLLAHPHVGFAGPTRRDDMVRVIETYLVGEESAERLTTAPRDRVYILH